MSDANSDTNTKPQLHEMKLNIRVRYVECDTMGVLHHSRYLPFFEMGRTELLRSSGVSYKELEQRGILFVVTRIVINYKRPARYDDDLELVTRITRMTHVRIEHTYEMYNATTRELLCTGESTIACVGKDGGVQAIPEFLGDKFHATKGSVADGSFEMDYDLVILGAGAAGMMGAVAAGERAAALGKTLRIGVLEKNAKPGIKVLVCGGGRCNFTNAGSVDFLIEQFGRNGRFLTPALKHLDNDGLRAWFAEQGVPSHEEHDGKIYPDSNQAKSVVDSLLKRMKELGVEVLAGAGWAAASVEKLDAGFRVTTVDGHVLESRTMMLAVGGMSYQRMGTTGDGYRIAEGLGHAVVTPRPAIVGLLCKEDWPREMPGLAVNDVEVRIEVSGPLPRLATGKPTPSVNDILFTHFGLSGPAVLNLSEIVAELLEKFDAVTIRVDFVRDLSHAQLGELFRSWQQRHGKKLVRKMLAGEESKGAAGAAWSGLPTRLAEMFCKLESISPEQMCATLTSAQIHRLVERVKASRFAIHETRGFKEAMVTAGGVALAEVDPHTYESKVVPGFYITGEVLDLTGPSGGYNLQLAFSTGHLAGTRVAERLAGI